MILQSIEQSYELSPLQQGMLFHSLGMQESGVDIEQIACRLNEELVIPALLSAWQRVVAHHPILRTSFRWEGLTEPLQDVHRHVGIPVEQLDWRGLTTGEQEQRWVALLEADRRRGFDLTQVPLMRLTLVSCGTALSRLLWTFHHALLDGRSFPVVLRQVFSAYSALRDGQEVRLPECQPYRDYISWLREQDLTGAEAYWQETLKGFRAPTSLLTYQGTTKEFDTRHGHGAHEVRLTAKTTAALRDFGRSHPLTLNTLLQGAWALLLYHYSGEEDVVFGATRACRPSTLADGDAMVGLFINTLPLRVHVEPEARLIPWLQGLRAQHVALRAYEHTPLVKIQSWSEVPRGLPLFDSILVFENYLLDTALRAQGGEWTGRQFQYLGQTNYPLTLIAYADTELLLRLEYDRQRFDDATTERMLGHVCTLLEGMCAAPDQTLSQVPLLTRAEEQYFLDRWDRGAVRYAQGECIHQRFEAQAERIPDAIAAAYEGQTLTYRELNRRANRLAHKLRSLGVGPEALVGLCAERSLEMVTGILAILKAGGAYVPLDPGYPRDRLAFMLEDSSISVLVTQRQLASSLPPYNAHVVHLDTFSEAGSSAGPAEDLNLNSGVTAENLAYVIYTSGSTGKPKGVMVTHRNVVRLFQATDGWFSFGTHDVWTLFHSYAFDFSVWELWGALLYGGRLIVVPYWVSRSPEAFCEVLRREKVTVLNQTPSAFRQLMPAVLKTTAPEELPLRYVIFGGEALELQSLQPWMERYGDERPRLINMYGITETTVHVTYRPITSADVYAGVGSTIGVPIPDLSLHLLNQHGKLVPIGVPGEMHVGGAGVARGYLQRPELTAERFIPDPFSKEKRARLYRSGDLARRLPNGDLEYLGRIDHQVKIRGFRIELGEIETVLGQHPAVREAVVIAREDIPGDKRLVAYFAAEDGVALDEIRSLLRGKLPEHMVPSAFVRLNALPLTANGKVDRRALPIPDQERPELSQQYTAPRNPAEETLSQIWSAVLGVKEVGVYDNFFELGGDSILIIQVIAKARQAGLQLTPKDLFKYPTIAELAAASLTSSSGQTDQGQVVGTVALTPIQHWFFEQGLPDVHYWNQSFFFEVTADLDLAALEAALRHVILHHDALRLRFKQEVSSWRQFYAEGREDFSLTRVDLSALSESEQASALESNAANLQTTLNLSEGPLFRAAHFLLGRHRPARLLLIIHHLVVDGVSWRLLMEDLEAAYLALRDKKPVLLPAKTTSFQTWSERLREYAKHPALQQEFDYWCTVPDTDAVRLPIDLPPQGVNSEESARTVTIRLSPEETDTLLHYVPTVYHTQINDVLLTALAQCLGKWTEGDSLLVDLEGHGREDVGDGVDLSRTVGWFTTIFPVRLDLRPVGHVGDALKAVKERLRQIPGHGFGYGVLRYLGENPTVAQTLRSLPQAAVVFNYLGQFDHVLSDSTLFRFAREDSGPWHGPRGQRRHLLEVLALVSNARLEVRLTYSQNVHRRGTIERLAKGFLDSLRAIIAHCETAEVAGYTPSDFPLAKIDQPTLDRVLRDYPGVEDLYGLSPMQQLFHSMEAAHSGLGFEQWHFALHGPLDVKAFKRAWGHVVQRHTILRSAFVSDGLPGPLQAVLRHVQLPWSEHDWRTLPQAEQEERLRGFLRADSELGFDLSRPPLTRLALLRTAEETYHFVWSTHHLLIDGWSWPVIFTELSALYDAYRLGQEGHLGHPVAYRTYIAWLQKKNEGESETFWRRQLQGIAEPTPFAFGRPQHVLPGHQDGFGKEETRVPVDTTAALQSLARTHQVTLNTLMQGAWGLLLGHHSGRADVLFGAAFSGRPPELPGVEAMAGPCVNNLPVRVCVQPEELLISWLKRLQEEQFEASRYQYSSLLQIQQWSQVPWRFRLFDSLLVFQNYVVGDAGRQIGSSVKIHAVATPEMTNYPVTLMAVPGQELQLKILYRHDQCDGDYVRSVLQNLRTLLEAMATSPTRSLSQFTALLPTPLPQEAVYPGASKPAPPTGAGSADALPSPRTEMERTVAAIWQELFQVERVGMEDNFFDLGGHSLLLAQAHKQLQNSLGRTLPIVSLFRYPTVRSLARYLSHDLDGQPTTQGYQDRAKRQQEALARQKRLARRA